MALENKQEGEVMDVLTMAGAAGMAVLLMIGSLCAIACVMCLFK